MDEGRCPACGGQLERVNGMLACINCSSEVGEAEAIALDESGEEEEIGY